MPTKSYSSRALPKDACRPSTTLNRCGNACGASTPRTSAITSCKPPRLVGWLIPVLAAVTLWAPARGQDRVLPQQLYQRADRALRSGDFNSAFKDFSDYAATYPGSPARGAALLGAAKAAVYSGRHENAMTVCEAYLKENPLQPMRALAHLYMGHALVATRHYQDAVRAYAAGYAETSDQAIREALRNVARTLALQLSRTDAQEALSLENDPEFAWDAWSQLGARLEQAGQRYRAASLYGAIADRYPKQPLAQTARARQREIEAVLMRTVRVGLLLPLSGTLARYGDEIRRGVELAARQYTRSTGREVDLMVEDTEGMAVTATRACQSLLQRDPVAIIGPLTSYAAVGCAAAATAAEVPLVIPAASETGLSTLGNSVFCLSPSVESYGRTLGRYVVEGHGLCSHLIIAPNDSYGYETADAYRRAVEAAGGEIWHETYYEPGTTDFGPYLRAYKASFLDTLSDTTWFYAPDSTKLDYEEVTVYPDAIFVPGYVEDLVLLVPQIRFYKVAGRLIGTDSFGDEELLMRTGGNLEEALFASVQPVGEGVAAWERFAGSYSSSYGQPPGRMAGLGFDAFGLLAAGLVDSLRTPRSLGRYLARQNEYEGASGHIQFGAQGENTRVPVYYIRNRRISAALR